MFKQILKHLTTRKVITMDDISQDTHKIAKLFKVIGDPSRLKIMQLLMKDQGVCVSEVAEYLSISIPATSQHLKLLELHELLTAVRMGQRICYRPNYSNDRSSIIIQAIKSMEDQ